MSEEKLRKLYPDPVLFFSVFLLSTVGFLVVLSVRVSPYIFEGIELSDLKRPILFLLSVLFGFFLMVSLSFINYRKLNNQRLVYLMVGVSLTLLAVVIAKKLLLGKRVERWLFGGSVQPSEFSKVVITIFVAYYVARKGAIEELRYFLWAVLVVVAHSLLLFLQPDKGMAVLLLTVAWAMLWVGGTSPRVYLPVGFVFVLTGAFMLFTGGDYVLRRLSAWRNPMEDPFGSGYQVIQSLFAFINGGFWGQGLGKGFQKFGILTQADTDYALATIGEELGFPGIAFLLLLYITVARRLIRIARETTDTFGRLLVTGIALHIILSSGINVMMAVNILPPKGIPLPFVSYGVSNMMMNFVSLGIVGAVYRRQLRYRVL
ncbi:MAG TPA: FtsW/RodA/SpoVE family cell cycle protein [Aquifex aeolicus]|nr:FtsW/RodA/SpoVE family cell cycle protein [Aquifex aeolicus]